MKKPYKKEKYCFIRVEVYSEYLFLNFGSEHEIKEMEIATILYVNILFMKNF